VTDGRVFGERLAARAARAGVVVDAQQAAGLAVYVELLSRWNRRINLTALPLEPLQDVTLDRLLVEPLAAAAFVPESPRDWFDLGSGGGSPAIPLKIARRAARLTMVESRTKKCAFLREVIRELNLFDATVLPARVEALEMTQAADLITIRALGINPRLLAGASRLLRAGADLFIFGFPAGRRAAIAPFTEIETRQLLWGSGSELAVLRAR
jgi:16S rRNA (guanine527-N7)-methyltransferase